MPCRRTKVPVTTDTTMVYAPALVCSPATIPAPRCVVCYRTPAQVAMRLCDAPLTGEYEGQTCDTAVCVDHAVHEEPETDWCPRHAQERALDTDEGGPHDDEP